VKNEDRNYWQIIWNKFKAGDRQAFETIYNEFVDVLYAYGSKITSNKSLVEDSIQDLFIDVYKYGSKLRQPEYLEYYLFKSLKRIIIRKLKENSKFDFTNDSFEQFNLSFSIEDVLEKEQLEEHIQLLQNEINDLDAKKRELLFLKFNSGLTYVEIGEMLDMKPDTVKKQVQRLLKYIQLKMGNTLLELFVLSVKL
jgi:RNA polymerase sigma factor (sigma-70 family)